jgi:hypothetical protein
MYERSEADEQYSSLASEMALLRMLIKDLLLKLDRGEGETPWEKLLTSHRRMTAAIKAGNEVAIKKELGTIAEIIDRGGADRDVRKQLQNAIVALTRVSRGEWQRLHDLAQFLPRKVVEKMLLIENQLLIEVFGDMAKIQEYRRRMKVALYPILG